MTFPAADDGVKNNVRYWTARLCASDAETLDAAKEHRAQIQHDDPDRSLTIVDALIAETEGATDISVQLLRDRDDPDSRTALFGVLARSRGVDTALGVYENRMDGADAGFFTAIGWRNWAHCMAEVGRWQEAAGRLAALGGIWTEAPVLSVVEGIINAQLLLPPERRKVTGELPLFLGISPNQGEQAERAHARATDCFELAQAGLQGIEDAQLERFIADWRRWLRLMDPNDENARDAHDEVRESLENDTPDVKLIPFAFAVGISFNPDPLHRYLVGREKLGGLNDDELQAECLMFLIAMNSGEKGGRDFLDYLETRQARLARVVPDGLLEVARIDALVRDNQVERARALLAEKRSGLGELEAIRLSAMIDAHEGRDPRKDLERAYSETKDIIDLQNLVQCLKQGDDREALLPLLEDLMEKQRTVDNAMDLVVCLGGRPFFDHRRIIEFLDSNPDLVEQSLNLKSVKARALFNVGRFSDARKLNDQLPSIHQTANAVILDINIAVATGDWERLPAIVDREWPRRNEQEAETLLTLAHFAAHQGGSPARALKLAKLAAEKAPDDPRVLADSYWLHFQLGRDEEVDQSWLSRAFELSSPDDGPLWSFDIRTLVTKWMPERREQVSEIEERWRSGEIPTGVAASVLNVPLTRLLLQIPEANAELDDRRVCMLVPVVFGGRPRVELQEDWAVGLDITSILILHYIDLLESTFEACHHVKLAPDVMHCLFKEQDRVRFHQPSRVRDGQQVRNLCHRHRLRVADDSRMPPRSLSVEVGRELASLLQAARSHDGRVVCILPIHRPDSLLEKEADTTEWNELIVSVPDFCRLLHLRGSIDAETHERAQLFLRSQGQVERGRPDPSILDGTIYIDGLALSYLQNAKVLNQIAAAGVDLRIHSDILRDMDELAGAGYPGDDLAARIDEIRHVLRNVIEGGRASYLPREIGPEGPVTNHDGPFITTQSLLAGTPECDALCIDDRFLNSRERLGVSEEHECVVPIVCVLDILHYLAGCGRISPERHWTAQHKLRSGGFIFIPFEADELVYWLKPAAVENGQLIEGAELRAIRQSMVRTITLGLNNPEERFALFVEATQTSVSAIRALWRDESLPMESAAAGSDWIWRHLVVDAPGDHGNVKEENRREWIRESTLRRIASILLLPGIESPERCVSYSNWVEESVLDPLRRANPELIEQALISVADMISDLSSEAETFGNPWLTALPESSRQFLVTRYPDRVRRWGFETRRILGLESDVAIVDRDLFAAARQVFSGKGARSLQSTSGSEVSVDIDPEDNNIVLTCPGVGSGNKRKISELAILSPEPQARVTALSALLDRFGPTDPDFSRLLSDLESREPDEAEISAILREATGGVAAVQGALLRKLHFGQPIGIIDILPQDLDYFKHFVGPQPETREPERYIRETLIPYRKALLDRELSRGLDICCLGALRDDLCPGQWTVHFDDDVLWQALSTSSAEGAPISLIGALDVALYRQNDARFHEYAANAVMKLCDDGFGQPQEKDFYRFLWILTRFTFNRINLIGNGAKQPGFWKRMCAWMQAHYVARALSQAPVSIDMDRLEEWSLSGMALVGAYAELVDAREEPMLLFTERTPTRDMRCEILGRLMALRSRHMNERRNIPQSEEIDRAVKRAQERGNWLKCFFPGPLEGHRRPVAPAPDALVETLEEAMPDVSLPESWHFIANASQLHALGEPELGAVRSALTGVPDIIDDGGTKNNLLLTLEIASIIAKACRDRSLADAVGDAVSYICTKASNENDIWLILVICLQSAAAIEEEDEWFDWLDETLARIAARLPGPPDRSVRIFLEHLDAMEKRFCQSTPGFIGGRDP